MSNEQLHAVCHSSLIALAEDNLVTTKRWLRLDNKLAGEQLSVAN